ncbi:BRO family protein [Methylomonas methanica]|uniref:BRO domain protein n=1 Tax=Methylomonas methanica (strain DSM 25384 / MC09) TaxID=857087 RepID=G0A3S2_METMM|nr:BRO family protein [Methylomonas methanica]AEG02694.1 BRO domain protein [Methylomonas methanica MC09]
MPDKRARVVPDADGNPLFVAQDAMMAIGYHDLTDVTEAIKHVPEEWKAVASIPTLDGAQKMDVLTEQGLIYFLGPYLAK